MKGLELLLPELLSQGKSLNFYVACGRILTCKLTCNYFSATKMAVYNEIKDFLKRVPNHPDSNKFGVLPDTTH